MALIKSVRGFDPIIGENCYLADNATIIGDVVIGNDCSIWFNAVLRGDVNSIRIGDRVNIQDGSVLHTLYQKSVVEIGNDVSVGHNVTIHGATIKDGALIGNRNGEEYRIMDDASVMEFFRDNCRKETSEFVKAFLARIDFFGQDLTEIEGLVDTIIAYLDDIKENGMRSALCRLS
jgi:NDP-sugar pyrophosphorylase family protein